MVALKGASWLSTWVWRCLRVYRELGRHTYVTPTSYLELIYTYQELLGQQRAAVLQLRRRYEVRTDVQTTISCRHSGGCVRTVAGLSSCMAAPAGWAATSDTFRGAYTMGTAPCACMQSSTVLHGKAITLAECVFAAPGWS